MVGWLVRDQGKKGQGLRRQKKCTGPVTHPTFLVTKTLVHYSLSDS